MTITLKVNMITRQITPFFSSTLSALLIDMFHLFTFQDLLKSVPWGLPFALCSGLYNTSLQAKDKISKLVNIDTLFLHKIC